MPASHQGPGEDVPETPRDRLTRILGRMSQAGTAGSIEPMPGGASTRQFFRVTLDGGRTGVAMFVPEVGKPDEIVKVDERGRRWPFLEVRDLLDARGVPVPGVIADACAEGFLIVDDLGDDTLARYLEKHPERRETLYELAVRDLALAQRSLSSLPADSIVNARAFDYDL